MAINTTTINNIILKNVKQLSRLGLTIMWLELIVTIWMVSSLAGVAKWSNTPASEHIVTFLSILLALCILFLQYKYRLSLPKNNSDAIAFKHEEYKKPSLLRALLAIQIITLLYGAFSTSAWGQLYNINIFSINSFSSTFNLIVFFALHLTIIIGIAFLIKLAQINKLVSNSDTEEMVNATLKKLYQHAAIFCIVTLLLLSFLLIPKLPAVFSDIRYFISTAQIWLLIYLTQIALSGFLIYAAVYLFRAKKAAKTSILYRWITILLVVDLYVSLEVLEGGVRVLLEIPEVIVPMLLRIAAEAWLLAILIRISTYSTLKKLNLPQNTQISSEL